MKSEILNIRMTESLRRRLDILAYEREMKVSDLVRDILEEKTARKTNQETVFDTDYGLESLHSENFMELYSCIMQLYFDPFRSVSRNQCILFKKLLFETIAINGIPQEVKIQFEKILQDVLRFLNEPDYQGKSFRFCFPDLTESVDYKIITRFVADFYFNKTTETMYLD